MIATTVRTLAKRWLVARHRRTFPFENSQRRLGCLFIHVPKVAGTAILTALGKSRGGRCHLPWYVYRAADPLFFNRAWKFAFVRDPWDRAYSAWAYLRSGGNLRDDLRTASSLQQYHDFDAFVVKGLGNGAFRNHPLFLPQSEFILDIDGHPVTDFIGRYETLQQDFMLVAKKLRLRETLIHANSGPEPIKCYREKYTSTESIALIRAIYQQDITAFGYDW
jgi:hypothetical protein